MNLFYRNQSKYSILKFYKNLNKLFQYIVKITPEFFFSLFLFISF
jgi:hypothetical protein